MKRSESEFEVVHGEDACKGLEGWVRSVGFEWGVVGCGGFVEVLVCVDEYGT